MSVCHPRDQHNKARSRTAHFASTVTAFTITTKLNDRTTEVEKNLHTRKLHGICSYMHQLALQMDTCVCKGPDECTDQRACGFRLLRFCVRDFHSISLEIVKRLRFDGTSL